MEHPPTGPARGVEILLTTSRSQAVTVSIPEGQSRNGASQSDGKADQWLYVLAGTGRARISDESIALEPGTIAFIEAGEEHEINNDGEDALETLNFYMPPVY